MNHADTWEEFVEELEEIGKDAGWSDFTLAFKSSYITPGFIIEQRKFTFTSNIFNQFCDIIFDVVPFYAINGIGFEDIYYRSAIFYSVEECLKVFKGISFESTAKIIFPSEPVSRLYRIVDYRGQELGQWSIKTMEEQKVLHPGYGFYKINDENEVIGDLALENFNIYGHPDVIFFCPIRDYNVYGG